jgi:hypothetical protein
MPYLEDQLNGPQTAAEATPQAATWQSPVIGPLMTAVAPTISYVQARSAELRASPSHDSPSLGTLPYEAKIRVLQQSGDWVLIVRTDGTPAAGWMESSSLRTTAPVAQ